MMVPRHYLLHSSPPKENRHEHSGRRTVRHSVLSKSGKESASALRSASPEPTKTGSARPASKPVPVPTLERSASAAAQSRSMPTRSRNVVSRGVRKQSAAHDPNALPPAIAALLAVTAIPPPRSSQFRRKAREQQRMSIDELVNEWKSDDTWKATYSSSPGLSILLEDGDNEEQWVGEVDDGMPDNGLLHTRKISSDSIPSLDSDDRSVMSMGSPATPDSLRSRKSSTALKRERARSIVPTEDSSLDHPLGSPSPLEDDDDLLLRSPPTRPSTPRAKSSFKSNLTASLRALKTSFASFNLSSATAPAQRPPPSSLSDEMLWSHPFLFPRLSPEIRPSIDGLPTEAHRRYLNPSPLTFEEQEAPFQQALHAPYLAEPIADVPYIPMQTYGRGRRKASAKRTVSDPNSEAGRALPTAAGVRPREPRENSDFLRVVVLEMNMRREGKLEAGRARIWLPPRQNCAPAEESKVPKRWVGVSAY